jgi:hypothetical protein
MRLHVFHPPHTDAVYGLWNERLSYTTYLTGAPQLFQALWGEQYTVHQDVRMEDRGKVMQRP